MGNVTLETIMLNTIDYNDPLTILMNAESDEQDCDGESLYATNAERTGFTRDNDRDDMLGASPAELAYVMLDS